MSAGRREDSLEALIDSLELLHLLRLFAEVEGNDRKFDVSSEDFLSCKLNQKLLHQIQVGSDIAGMILVATFCIIFQQDPLVLCCEALPQWCHILVASYPFLFPFETRQLFFNAMAFGPERLVY